MNSLTTKKGGGLPASFVFDMTLVEPLLSCRNRDLADHTLLVLHHAKKPATRSFEKRLKFVFRIFFRCTKSFIVRLFCFETCEIFLSHSFLRNKHNYNFWCHLLVISVYSWRSYIRPTYYNLRNARFGNGCFSTAKIMCFSMSCRTCRI